MSIFSSLSRWRPAHLFFLWCIYWVAFLAVTLGPAIPAILRATGQTAGKGEISANVSGSVVRLTVKEIGQTTWHGSVHMLTAALWLAVPPLIVWVLWVASRGAATRQSVHDATRV